ncbi:hypothetical protein GGE45_002887 [Rhizobium aethiopicum]|uniref:Uncharacterized protein n=1 Tax=Rhizobium aethiopicum TaxID=1138170 RepID=A0A7W6MEP1_9HYPH|nr:hypothetical protein [Rhizobium aethiopicum]MBB4191320.1 hypothetical protein [Rhizobium aethiopicum]MBB4580552.1 hypothetical protein [Rhizobium aethiopicum]
MAKQDAEARQANLKDRDVLQHIDPNQKNTMGLLRAAAPLRALGADGAASVAFPL